MTFLGPPGQTSHEPEPVDRAAWQKEFARRSRPAEQSFRARWTQVGMAIGFQFLMLRLGMMVVGFSHADEIMRMDLGLLPAYLAVLVLGVYGVSALAAGAIAGAWCVNWILQGIAVGIGWVGVLFAHLLLILPFDMVANLQIPLTLLAPLFAVALVNTALAIAGAFIGHLMIQPLRLSIEGDSFR